MRLIKQVVWFVLLKKLRINIPNVLSGKWFAGKKLWIAL
jgi:hypothetical protein